MARLKRNDKLLLTWVDIVGDEGGDPADADLGTWQTVCYFVRLDRKRETGVNGYVILPLIERTTDRQSAYDDGDESGQQQKREKTNKQWADEVM